MGARPVPIRVSATHVLVGDGRRLRVALIVLRAVSNCRRRAHEVPRHTHSSGRSNASTVLALVEPSAGHGVALSNNSFGRHGVELDVQVGSQVAAEVEQSVASTSNKACFQRTGPRIAHRRRHTLAVALPRSSSSTTLILKASCIMHHPGVSGVCNGPNYLTMMTLHMEPKVMPTMTDCHTTHPARTQAHPPATAKRPLP
jgi:hypothetical protein